MTKNLFLIALLSAMLLSFLTGCNKPNKEPIKKENPWKQYAYGELPQLDFNKSPKEIKEEEYKMGARMVTQQDEYEGQSLIFSSYPHTGLVLRKYFFQQNRLVEVIQLIRPLSEVIKYDGKDSFTLNTTFQEWARSVGFNFSRSRVKDYYFLNEVSRLQMVVLPAQINPNGGEILAEMHFFMQK